MMHGTSNMQLKANAQQSTEAAKQATDAAKDGDGSHRKAASAHYEAKYANERAGNGTQADKHAKLALVHGEKAASEERTKYFAEDLGRSADALSKKAALEEQGEDKSDPRDAKELHASAAEAHGKAKDAFKIAGDARSVAYHRQKAKEHTAAAK